MVKLGNGGEFPFHEVKIEKQFEILKDLVNEYRKKGEAVLSSEIPEVTATKPRIFSTLGFFAAIDWIEKPKRGSYFPKKDLIRFLTGLNPETSKKNLIETLLQTNSADRLFYFVERKGIADKEELIKFMGKEFELERKHKSNVIRLIELFKYLDIFTDEDDSLKISNWYLETKSQKIPEESEDSPIPSREKKIEKQSPLLSDSMQTEFIPQISIKFEINSDTDEEKLRNCIKIILEEMKGLKNGE